VEARRDRPSRDICCRQTLFSQGVHAKLLPGGRSTVVRFHSVVIPRAGEYGDGREKLGWSRRPLKHHDHPRRHQGALEVDCWSRRDHTPRKHKGSTPRLRSKWWTTRPEGTVRQLGYTQALRHLARGASHVLASFAFELPS